MTERWNSKVGKQLPSDPRVEAFLDEIEQVCRKHELTISHEDHHGAFEIEDFGDGRPAGEYNSTIGKRANVGEYNIAWLRAATDNRPDRAHDPEKRVFVESPFLASAADTVIVGIDDARITPPRSDR